MGVERGVTAEEEDTEKNGGDGEKRQAGNIRLMNREKEFDFNMGKEQNRSGRERIS